MRFYAKKKFKSMHKEFEKIIMGELNFFFGLQIRQNKKGVFINQAIYNKELIKSLV